MFFHNLGMEFLQSLIDVCTQSCDVFSVNCKCKLGPFGPVLCSALLPIFLPKNGYKAVFPSKKMAI